MLRIALLALLFLTPVFADEIDDLSQQAIAAENRGDLAAAKSTWNTLIQKYDQNGEGGQYYHYRLARIHAKEEKWTNAIKAFQSVFKGNWKAHFDAPAIPLLHYAEAQVHLSNFDAALRIASDGLNSKPAPRVGAMLRRVEAVALYLKGDLASANAAWEAARQLENGWGEAPFDPEIIHLNKAIAAQPRSVEAWRARISFFETRFRMLRENEDAAMSHLNESTEGKPSRPNELKGGSTRLLGTRGGASSAVDFLNDAINDATQWMRVAPKDVDARLTRANLRRTKLGLTLGRNELASQIREDLDAAVRLDSRHLGARLARADWIIEQLAPEAGNTTFQADFRIANGDISTVLLNEPSAKAYLLRCRLERKRAQADPYTILYSAVAGTEMLKPVAGNHSASLSDKEKVELFLLAAQACTQRGLTTRALEIYQMGIHVIDTSEEQWGLFSPRMELPFRMIVLLVELGRFEAALPLTDRYELLALESFDKNGGRMLEVLKAAILEGTGKLDEARDLIKRYKETHGSVPGEVAGTTLDPDAPTTTPFARVRRPADQLPIVPPDTPEEWKKRGNAALGEKNFAVALAHYNNALLIDPAYADAMNNRALCYVEEEKTDLALYEYSQALKANPEHFQTYFNRAKTWASLSERGKALADLEKAESFAPTATKPLIFDRRATYLQEEGRFEESLLPLTNALAIEQSEERWQLLLYAHIALQNWAQVATVEREAKAFAPNSRQLRTWGHLGAAIGAADQAAFEDAVNALSAFDQTKKEQDARWMGNVARLLAKHYGSLSETSRREPAFTRAKAIQERMKSL